MCIAPANAQQARTDQQRHAQRHLTRHRRRPIRIPRGAGIRVLGPTRNVDVWYGAFDVKPGDNNT